MRSMTPSSILKTVTLAVATVLLTAAASFAQQQVNLTAGQTTLTLPDGNKVPMWGYSCGAAVPSSSATCAKLNPSATGWSPIVITIPSAAAGGLGVNLTNALPAPVPTSLVIVGQLGGGLGKSATTSPSPNHDNIPTTWPIANTGPDFVPPVQGPRVQSFSTEVAAGTTTLNPLVWANLQPGTYLIESGTHPSIQGPMGLYGMLVVTTAPVGATAGTAYPGVNYNAESDLLFSEIDPAQNAAVQAAATTPGFSETATIGPWLGGPVVSVNLTSPGAGYTSAPTMTFSCAPGSCSVAATGHTKIDTDPTSSTYGQVIEVDIDTPGTYLKSPSITFSAPPAGAGHAIAVASAALQLNANAISHCSGGAAACYPPAVNYTPLYYLINGVGFDKTHASASLFPASPASGVTAVTGHVLVRMVNAGLRMHVPSIVGSTTGASGVGGFSLIAEDGNLLPGVPRVQSEVFMAAGKTYDVMLNAPAAAAKALPVFDRELSLSGNATARDAGMLAYISVNSAALPSDPAFSSAVANADAYSVVPGNTLTISDMTKGVIGNDFNVFGVKVFTAPAGTVSLNSNGTFAYTPPAGWTATSNDSFVYAANGATSCQSPLTSPGPCATVSLTGQAAEAGSGITVNNKVFTSNVATFLSIKSPGILATGGIADKDAAGYPLTVAAASIAGTGGNPLAPCPAGVTANCVAVDAAGGFNAYVNNPGTYTFSYKAQNAQGTQSVSAATVTLNFPTASGLQVSVKDGKTLTPVTDYRWVIEEDRTFYIDPTKTTNTGGSTIVPTFGTNFHTSYMPVVATGCVGALACESGQTIGGKNVVCDIGDGVCEAGMQQKELDPKFVNLDPTKRYYISVLPGDAANPFIAGNGSACLPTTDPNYDPTSCGHGMGGAQVNFPAANTPVTVLVQPTPFPPSKLSVFVFEDDFPLNGEQDAGGGVDVLAPNEPGLGGFNITLFDDAGGTGDATGQMTYDMFNQPLVNSLAGTPDPANHNIDACPISKNPRDLSDPTSTGITGTIVTCPKYEADGTTLSPLAGQAIVANLMPGRYGVVATPAADRIAKGEEWLQTNTLDGQKAHDSFLRIGEPSFFQEYGPASYHVAIGFANPKIINARLKGVCNGTDINVTGTNCTNSVSGMVTTERMSRTPDQRLYSSGSNDSFSFTQCYVSIGDPDGEDFAFTKCNGDGTFSMSGLPNGSWRITVFDQWNDMLVDGLSTPVLLGGGKNTDMGQIAMNQWQANLYTKTFFDTNKNGIQDPGEPGLTLVPTNIRFRDGSYSNFNNTDLSGNAGFNEEFPLFSWYVVESDTTRYKNTGTHVVYDAGGPADGTPCGASVTPPTAPCGTSAIGTNYANTIEQVPLPTSLRVPGARYCESADCPTGDSSGGSTGRVDPPYVYTEGWQGFSGQNSFIEFGKAPFANGENGGIHGEVIYASTRPFDDPGLLIHTSWTPDVPNVTVNLYQEGTAPDGTTSLTLVDTTTTSSWDDWAQGFRSDHIPNMNCPGQTTADLFYFTLFNQPQWLDLYSSQHGGAPTTALPNNSQFKCYDGLHTFNQIQPAPYDGRYQFPSIAGRNPTTGVPTGGTGSVAGTNCTICIVNPADGTPMLPSLGQIGHDGKVATGKYVVEMVVPPGYELVKEEDKNILIGDNYIAPVTQEFGGLGSVFILPDQAEVGAAYNPNNAQNPTQTLGRTTLPSNEGDTGSVETFWPCVGEARIVPDYISLYPNSKEVAPFAGAKRNLCDRKEVTLDDQASVLAKFWVFTSAHVAAHFTGVITDDFTSEFDPFSPQFGEKFSPANLPISIKDWTGTEISRVYTDQWGSYNGLTYSTWEVNPPNPTGYAPTMMVTCMNDPGTGATPDPLYNPAYSQFCYEIPFMPGQTQYMDTPVVPTSAFVGAGYNNPDCAYPDATPAIKEVDGDGIGPWVLTSSSAAKITAVTLTSGGNGYTTAPGVTFTGGTGTGATATTTLGVASVSVTGGANSGGSGYTSAPTVGFTGTGSGAVASASMGVGAVTGVTNPGTGYTNADEFHLLPVDQVSLTGSGGSGAAVEVWTLKLVGINITGSRTCTTTAPTVTFTEPPGHVQLAAPVVTVVRNGAGLITGFTITNGGSFTNILGGNAVPTVTLTGGTGCSGTITLTAAMGLNTVGAPITAGSGYTSVPTGVSGDGGTGATISTTLRVSAVAVSASGSGYTGVAGVTFTGGGGTGAHGTATMDVGSVTLTADGSNYSAPVTVGFTGGGGSGAAASATLDPTAAHSIIITALGDAKVNNNAYAGPSATTAPYNQKTITRHYGFGTVPGTVTIGGKTAVVNPGDWTDSQIKAYVPGGVPPCAIQQQAQYAPGASQALCGELVITAANGKQSIDTVTVTIGGKAPKHVPTDYPTIQTAIDQSAPGDLVIVNPGTYTEFLLMWKPLRLQGVGAASSVLNANTHPAGKLDPWRAQVNCLFGLALNGQPYTGNANSQGVGGGSNPYDATGASTCPGTGWNYFSGAPNQPQVDRLPLEGILGWDTTVNGNLAQLLQEPTLMGAYEGAGITVLSKGVNIPAGSADIFGSGAESAFPTGTTLLQNVPGVSTNHCTDAVNPYPSNFECNPSMIDGLSVTNSSQGGGGILVHAWGHNLQIANNRIYNNSGTLTGGITVGQGESPDAYLGGGSTTNSDPGSCVVDNSIIDTNVQLPYCFDKNVSIHNNMVTSNSSIGDELFSSTPAGAGGVTLCTGADYYQFNYNWVCGNLSTGDGGGLVHLGFIYNGDIEHNSILFNQSTNPTVPTNGGGIIVMGAPPDGVTAAGIECGGTAADADCVPGLSDGTGPNLNINANLIMGNSAESGSGGGLRLQGVNGTDATLNPSRCNIILIGDLLCNWNSVSVTNNIIANNVAGWDGAGISLQDALRVNIVNNTIISNDTTASSGVLFNTLGAPLASSSGPTTPTSQGTSSLPQVAGLVSTGNSPQLVSALPSSVNCPVGEPNCAKISNPRLYNNVIWHNRAFYIGVGPLGTGSLDQQNVVALFNAFTTTAAPSQPQADATTANGNGVIISGGTGACTTSSYWDIGVRGDLGPANHNSGFTLSPNYSILTDATDYPGNNNLASDPQVVSLYCNGSRVPPELGKMGYQVPPGISDATVPNPIFNLTPAATVDEGNNWINLSWGPLAETNPVNGSTLGNYALAAGSPAINKIPTALCVLNAACSLAPSLDFFGNPRPAPGGTIDIGAVEFVAAAASTVPTLATITPNTGVSGTASLAVTLTGTNLTGATAVSVDGTGVTATLGTSTATTVTATFAIDANSTTLGTHNVSVTTPNGITGFVLFTVVGTNPALTTIAPASGNLNTAAWPVTLTGTNLTGATSVNVDGTGVTATITGTPTATTVTANFAIDNTVTTTPGIHNVSVTTPNGTTGAVVFTVINPNPPTVTTIAPNTGALNTASLAVTLTGTNLTGATSVNVGGTGVSATITGTPTATTVHATFTIDANTTTLGSHLVSVTTPNGTTGTVTFTVATTVNPTVSSIYPPSSLPNKTVPVTITGTNFSAATTGITLSGTGVTSSAFTVVNPTTITATFTVASGAAIGPRTVTVTGATGSTLFYVGPYITSLTPNTGAPGDTPTIAIAGFQLSPTTNVTVSGNGITNTSPDFAVLDDSDITASFVIAAGNSAGGAHSVAVVTANGTSNALTYTVVPPPTLTRVSPTSGTHGTNVAFTMTGTNLTGASALNFSNPGITYGTLTVNGAGTSLTTTLTISSGAARVAGTVSVTTPGGTSNTRAFRVN